MKIMRWQGTNGITIPYWVKVSVIAMGFIILFLGFNSLQPGLLVKVAGNLILLAIYLYTMILVDE